MLVEKASVLQRSGAERIAQFSLPDPSDNVIHRCLNGYSVGWLIQINWLINVWASSSPQHTKVNACHQ